MFSLDTPLTSLTGVGPAVADRLKKLGLSLIRDLLWHVPFRYDDLTNIQPIRHCQTNRFCVINAEITQLAVERTPRKKLFIIRTILKDPSGELAAIWFNQPFLTRILKVGERWVFAGKVARRSGLGLTMMGPIFEKAAALIPIYHETTRLSSKWFRRIIGQLLTRPLPIEDFLTPELLKQTNLPTLDQAIKTVHQPGSVTQAIHAKRRLAFDELFFLILKTLLTKKELTVFSAPAMTVDYPALRNFVKTLPFNLTNGQRKAAWTIIQDLQKNRPMNRLLQGEVGSGKTVVGAMAAFVTARNHYQTVWLTPTEVLAEQHYQTLTRLLKPHQIDCALWTASQKTASLDRSPQAIDARSLTTPVIIATHAALQKSVAFPRLGLLIVDEQHRFGVRQRALLRQSSVGKGAVIPHFLSMSATPIPRTLALTLWADLDISTIDELPSGRRPVITQVVKETERDKIYQFIRQQVQSGRQVFIITPLIGEEDETPTKPSNRSGQIDLNLFETSADVKTATAEFSRLHKDVLPDLKLGLLHGRLASRRKQAVMDEFVKGQIDILVATAVVEVGIDVPNANVILIEGAERFGLAQLHQFRGRVGRGSHQSYCFLVPSFWSRVIASRLSAMVNHQSGFKLAEIDLKLRGPGSFTGVRQSGFPDLKMASLSDSLLIEQAKNLARQVVNHGLENYPTIVKQLEEFISARHLE